MILDSSVIASLFFRDNFSEKTAEIISSNAHEEFKTLDLAFAEVSNVAWKRVVIFGEDKEIALRQLRNAVNFIEDVCSVTSTEDIISDAIKLAVSEKLPFYDSAFLYLAIREKSKLLTTDLKLFNKVSNELKEYVITP
ncbi:type II toxin-antitoxin system VapC family toxin [Stygiolobus caldivivus]|uniref:Toxin VapC n=1 Tax=Stygiolobus caldivivus TaxID=2824673 RepID=A0A8D5U8C6_9CREN|nr:type II toxin-antitoxin system VapC family toxin [Stygiolobus caldivivus]BCU71665.1 toxin VapC [Stygiolobus caldivivus]